MIDYEEFCDGYEAGYRSPDPPKMSLARYAAMYRMTEQSGQSNGAGYWAGRLARLKESGEKLCSIGAQW